MNKLINDDAFKIMEEMIKNNEKVDVIISDPPYGKINGMILRGQEDKVNWDSQINWNYFFELAFKITNIVIMFGQNPTYAKMLLSTKYYKFEHIWVKNNCAQGFHADKMPLVYTENIAVFIKDDKNRVFNKITSSKEIDKNKYPLRRYSQQLQKWIMETHNLKSRNKIYEALPKLKKKGRMILDRRLEFFFFFNGTLFNLPTNDAYESLISHFGIDKWENFIPLEDLYKKKEVNKELVENKDELSDTINNIIYFPKDMNGLHPTQKPLKLMEFLVKTYSNKNDIIFDPFMGSGTTGLACKKLNRNFIGVELNEKYFQIAKERVESE